MVEINKSILAFAGNNGSQQNAGSTGIGQQTDKKIALEEIIATPSKADSADVLDLSPAALAYLQKVEALNEASDETTLLSEEQQNAAREILLRFESQQASLDTVQALIEDLRENNIEIAEQSADNDNNPQEAFRNLIDQLETLSEDFS